LRVNRLHSLPQFRALVMGASTEETHISVAARCGAANCMRKLVQVSSYLISYRINNWL
jgi:hypothetical protein